MPLFLVPVFSWIGSALLTSFAWFVTRKGMLFSVLVAVIAVVGTATNLLISQIDGLIGSVIPAVGFVAAFVPSNIGLCLSAIISTHLACTGFKLTMKFLRWKTTVLTS